MAMRFLTALSLLLLTASLTAQTNTGRQYWQQKLDYHLAAHVLPESHTIQGKLELAYTNESPDTLTFIWFHLWPNAYSGEQTALMQQLKRLKNRGKKLDQLKAPGSLTGLQWQVNGKEAPAEPHPSYNDVVKLLLPVPLVPGATVQIATPFTTMLPNYFSRSGFYENSLFVAQWYPKPAVYDHKGWHPMPYLDMGEFYSEFGHYTVDITLPSDYVVAATGILQNDQEAAAYKRIGKKNYELIHTALERMSNDSTSVRISFENYRPVDTTTEKNLRYEADRVHDFAFFTDPAFIINYDTLQLATHPVDVFSFYQKKRFHKWIYAVDDAKTAVQFYSAQVGEYPYPVVSLVQGANNENSGGMEYPTITLITMKEDAKEEAMDAVFAHEIGHNWFCGILASNERDHAWMDEGVNSFFQLRYEAVKNRTCTPLGQVPDEMKRLSANLFQDIIYQNIDRLPAVAVIDQPSQAFRKDDDYGLAVYIKTSAWLYALERKLGRQQFDACIKAYYAKWQFRHPYPEDMRQVFEATSGADLADFFQQLSVKKQTFR